MNIYRTGVHVMNSKGILHHDKDAVVSRGPWQHELQFGGWDQGNVRFDQTNTQPGSPQSRFERFKPDMLEPPLLASKGTRTYVL